MEVTETVLKFLLFPVNGVQEGRPRPPSEALRGCRVYSYGLAVRDGSWGSSARTSVLTGERVPGSNRKSSAYILLTRIRCFSLT